MFTGWPPVRRRGRGGVRCSARTGCRGRGRLRSGCRGRAPRSGLAAALVVAERAAGHDRAGCGGVGVDAGGDAAEGVQRPYEGQDQEHHEDVAEDQGEGGGPPVEPGDARFAVGCGWGQGLHAAGVGVLAVHYRPQWRLVMRAARARQRGLREVAAPWTTAAPAAMVAAITAMAVRAMSVLSTGPPGVVAARPVLDGPHWFSVRYPVVRRYHPVGSRWGRRPGFRGRRWATTLLHVAVRSRRRWRRRRPAIRPRRWWPRQWRWQPRRPREWAVWGCGSGMGGRGGGGGHCGAGLAGERHAAGHLLVQHDDHGVV